MGKSQRNKGHSFERKIAAELRGIFPKARRNLEYFVTREDEKGVDIDNTDEFRFQCKATKNYVPLNTIEEITRSCGAVPVLVAKADKKETLAVLPFKDFKKILAFYKKRGAHHGKSRKKQSEEE